MGNRSGCIFVEGTPNPKRTAAKKARGFGMGKVSSDKKEVLDVWCQSHDPLYKVKGKERNRRMRLRK